MISEKEIEEPTKEVYKMTVKFKLYGTSHELELSKFVNEMLELCRGVESCGGNWEQFYAMNVEVVEIS